MKIKIPKRLELKNLPPDISELENYRWAIGVPRKDALYWSVFMSVLMQATFTANSKVIKKFLKIITAKEDVEEEDVDEINFVISSHNPFMDRTSCYHENILERLVQNFRNSVNIYRLGIEYIEKVHPEELETEIDVIEHTLQTRITVLSENEVPVYHRHYFTTSKNKCSSGNNWLSDNKINILLHKQNRKIVAYGLKLEQGDEIQEKAFCEILRMSEINSQRDLLSLNGIRENLFVAMLIAERFEIVEELLRKPKYTLDRLQEAGFPTDPIAKVQITDSREAHSALYHALEKGKVQLLYLLYDYSIRMFCGPNVTVRNPDSNLSEEKMSDILKALNDLLEESGCNDLNDLVKFHKFQSEQCEWLARFNEIEISCDDYVSNAKNLKNLICDVMGSYIKNFHIPNDQYEHHMRFYKNLDHAAACLYFDHCFSLRMSLELYDIIEKMDSKYLRFIFICMYYYSWLNHGEPRLHLQRMHFGTNTLLELIKWERECFVEILKTFIHELNSKNVHEQNVKCRLLNHEIFTLTSEPTIKEEFMVRRLKHYLDLVDKVDLEEDNLIGCLIIEKTVVVLEDAIHLSNDEPTLAKSLLISMFSEEFCKNLRGARDIICDCFPKRIAVRMSTVHGLDFRKIQEYLKKNKCLVERVFNLQEIKTRQYLLRRIELAMEDNSFHEYNEGLTSNVKHVEMEINRMTKAIVTESILSNILQRVDDMKNEYRNNLGNEERLEGIRCLLRCSRCLLQSARRNENRDTGEQKPLRIIGKNDLPAAEKTAKPKQRKKLRAKNFNFIDETINEYKDEAKKIVKKNLSDEINMELNLDDKWTNNEQDASINDRTLEFFLDRVKKMKKLLIDDHEYFKNLWQNVKDSKREVKIFFREQLVSSYNSQSKLQAALEVLLLDCMDILYRFRKKLTQLNHLWCKRGNLFQEINLRHSFAHYDPLFDTVCKVLDPSDLPNDVLSKAMVLIEDYEVINEIYRLICSEDCCKNLQDRIEKAEKNDSYGEVCDKIKQCINWVDYLKLGTR